MSRRRLPALLLAAALAISGCGAARQDIAPNVAATLLLDAPPGAVHTGIYTAVARGYDDARGVNLSISAPSAATDAVRSLTSDRVQLAILPIDELAIARERGRDLVGVMAILQQPLTAIPGAPPFPPLVLSASRITLRDEPGMVRAALAAIARGYAEILGDPESGVAALLAATNGLDRTTVARELDALSPDFTANARFFGELDPARLRAWARWAHDRGKLGRLPDVSRAFDGRYVPRSGSRD